MATSAELLRQGVESARAGRRMEARDLFLQAVELDQQNEMAWMWLTGYVDDLEDKIIACENVLTINPANEKVRGYLETLLQQRAEKQQIELEQDEPLEDIPPVVWAPAPSAPVESEPVHSRPVQTADLLKQAEQLEQDGDLAEAVKTYELLAAKTKDSKLFDHAFKQIERLEKLKKEKIQYVPPTTSLLRLTFTWPLVYFSFVLIQVGLRPFGPGALLWLGLPVVVAGAFLLALSEVRIKHAIWQQIFQEDHNGSTFVRIALGVVGWVFVLLPFSFVLVVSLQRLQHFKIPPEPFF